MVAWSVVLLHLEDMVAKLYSAVRKVAVLVPLELVGLELLLTARLKDVL